MEVSAMPTLEEREKLYAGKQPPKSGFTPRRLNRLAQQKLPKTMLNIECQHLVRTSREESAHGHQSLEYQLWLEAGKHAAPFPQLSDDNYNSNVWRNFRSNYGFHLSSKGRKTAEVIASAYPVNIPKPSKVGNYTYGRFLLEAPNLIKDEHLREIAIRRTAMDNHIMEQLKIKSVSRYPPIDKDGNIMPPEHYKKHPHYFKPISDSPTTEYLVEQIRKAPPTPYGYHPHPIKYMPKKLPPWKFNLKSTNPNYQKVLGEIQRQREKLESPIKRVQTCTPATSKAPSEGGGSLKDGIR